MFFCHILVHRLTRFRGRRMTAHVSAAVALAIWLVVLLGMLSYAAAPSLSRAPLSAACFFFYVIAVYGALTVLYLDIVNIAETSLHMHLLLEIAWGERPSLDTLIARYSADRIVDERLDRLTALGQVRCVDGRYFLANRSALRLAGCVDAWRIVLGLPTSPEEAVQLR